MNLRVDDLIEEAKRLGHHRSEKEAVTAALEEYVSRRKQQAILSLFNSIEYDESYDYRAERKSSR